MTYQINKALENSIRHWARVVASPLTERIGPESCALCKRYYENYCEGCPVSKRTLKIYCSDSPFVAFAEEWEAASEAKSVSARRLKRLKKLAQAELDFLKSLRRGEQP